MGKTKSRANGDGDVFPRKNKAGKITSYRGAYVGPDGKRRYVSGKTKEEARKALREARSGADQGLVFDAARLTVAEYLDRWLKDSVQGSVRRSTYGSYDRQARRYVIPAVGRVRLNALTPAHVQGLYREMQDRGLSARTVEYTHAVLHRALKQAVRWSMVPRNVCDAVDVPQVRREDIAPAYARAGSQVPGCRPRGEARGSVCRGCVRRTQAGRASRPRLGRRGPGPWHSAREPRSFRRRVHHTKNEAEPEKDRPQSRKHRRP
jgi:hypothetical protein